MWDLVKKPDYRIFAPCGVKLNKALQADKEDISEQIYFIKVHEPIIKGQNEVTLRRSGANFSEPRQLCIVQVHLFSFFIYFNQETTISY